MSNPNNYPILFYDGDCGICNRSVRTLAHFDRKHQNLSYAPLQGSTAKELLPPSAWQNVNTAVLLCKDPSLGNHIVYERSDAILRALIATGSLWRIPAKIGLCFPAGFRDAIYNWVARNRHSFYGSDSCPLESPVPKDRLLN